MADVTALILAGGKARRMGGAAKHLIVVDGATIFARQAAVLAPHVAEILVSGAEVAGHRTVVDAEPGLGPLSGIAAGLAAAATEWLLVIAGDMPNISSPLVSLLIDRTARPSGSADGPTVGRAPECDAVGIRIGGRPEPLCSVLRVSPWRPIVTARIAARRLKASSLLTEEDVRVRWIEEAEVREIDPALGTLHNVNAPGDL